MVTRPAFSIIHSACKLMCLLTVALSAFSYSEVRADTLRDVLASRPMRKIDLDTEKARKRRDSKGEDERSWFNGMDPQSNFASMWGNNGGSSLPLSWIGANISQFKLVNTMGKRYRELVRTQGTILDRVKVPVKLEILIPHPTYRSMVQYKTLEEFNRFEPPALRVVATEDLTINGQKGTYYRSERGECSLLFKLSQNAIVNLSVPRCEQSGVMMDVAKALDYGRLDKKLSS